MILNKFSTTWVLSDTVDAVEGRVLLAGVWSGLDGREGRPPTPTAPRPRLYTTARLTTHLSLFKVYGAS